MAKAEKKKVESTCGKCGENKEAPNKSSKYGMVCESCNVELKQKDFTLDEYDLQPDEMTVEMVADKAQVSKRAVQIWNKDNLIPFVKVRRRVNGTVRKQNIYKVADVEQYLKEKDEPVIAPKIESMEKAKINEQNEFRDASQLFVAEQMGKLAESINNMSQSSKQLQAAPEETKPFLTVKDASDLTGLAQAEINRLINSEVISSFKGSKGEKLISRKQIMNL